MVEKRGRGRPRGFEVDEAIDQAIQVFWARGYEHTSLDDLLRAMQLSKSSFYQTFGSKQACYHRSIERYVEMAANPNALSLPPGLPAIHRFFETMADDMTGMNPRHGCYIGLVAMEMGNRDPDAAERSAAGLRAVESRFRDCILAAQRDGDVSAKKDPVKLARALTSTFYGIQIMGRARLERDVIEDVIQTAMAQLE
jgi:TetR/AcrR family transcriptional repressor of nem operon